MTRLMSTVGFFIMMTSSSFAVLDQAELAMAEKQVLATARLHGDEYVRSREALESGYKANPEYIRRLAESATNGQVRVVASIVLERVEKRDFIDTFLKWKPGIELYDHAQIRRINAMGKAIAEKGSNVPMFLVEAFWKKNELDPDPRKTRFFKSDPQWAYLANAIGQMKVGIARSVMEEALKEEFFCGKASETYTLMWVSVIKTEAAKALREIKSSDSVPHLMEALEKDPDLKNWETAYVMGALLACVDNSSKTFLAKKLLDSKDEKVKKAITRLLAEIDRVKVH